MRKSYVSQLENTEFSSSSACKRDMVDEQDRLLPIANVGRIMKQILPPSAKISKEAKQRMQDCATEFISFVTGEASDKCHKENRKTLNGDDICWALGALGFDNYAESIVRYLHKYREAERERAAASSSSQNKATIIISSSCHQDKEEEEDQSSEDKNSQPAQQTDHHEDHQAAAIQLLDQFQFSVKKGDQSLIQPS